jgi:hypothetical protein
MFGNWYLVLGSLYFVPIWDVCGLREGSYPPIPQITLIDPPWAANGLAFSA